jgi:hypothetical protein
MKKSGHPPLLLTGTAVLLLATGTAHARPWAMNGILYDWLILAPADIIAWFVVCALGLGALFAVYMTYQLISLDLITEKQKQNYGSLPKRIDTLPKRIITRIVAVMITVYVFAVLGTALMRIPHIMYMMDQQ